MKVLEDIKELIADEVKEIKKKGTHTPAEFEFMNTAVDTIDKIEDICKRHKIGSEYDEEYSGYNGYSGRTMPRMPQYYGYNGYDYRYSGANMMPMDTYNGNYYGGTGYYGRGYSGRSGRYGRYSGHNDPSEKVVRELREMLDRPMSEREREVIMETIDELSR